MPLFSCVESHCKTTTHNIDHTMSVGGQELYGTAQINSGHHTSMVANHSIPTAIITVTASVPMTPTDISYLVTPLTTRGDLILLNFAAAISTKQNLTSVKQKICWRKLSTWVIPLPSQSKCLKTRNSPRL